MAATQSNDYYPFGLTHVAVSLGQKIKYFYNGKELQKFGDLDYGVRHYDPVSGQWHVPDRFTEKYYNLSPYQYAANNPIINTDINGDSVRVYTETTGAGHVWISTGEGENMVVYSYGRYNGTNKGPDGRLYRMVPEFF